MKGNKLTDKPKRKSDLMKSPHLFKIAGLGKVGRPRLFSRPIDLKNACDEYFTWCIDNPLMEIDYRGKDADQVSLPHPRPFTLSGLMVYLGTSEKYWQWFRHDMEAKNNTEFLYIITHVEQTIRTQKYEYAATGFFNANIISRDLGLIDKTDITSGGEPIAQITDIQVMHSTMENDITGN